MSLRLDAITSIGSFCRSWPDQFRIPEVHDISGASLMSDRPELHATTIRALSTLLEDRRPATTESAGFPAPETHDRYSIGPFLVLLYLDSLCAIATSSQGRAALEVTKLLAIICAEGLVCPHVLYDTWVSLEISLDLDICGIATEQHQQLYERHGRLLRQYHLQAVRSAFRFQWRTLKDDRGATYKNRQFACNLSTFFEAVKADPAVFRQSFMKRYCEEIVQDIEPRDMTDTQSLDFSYSRFLVENLEFFPFEYLGDIDYIISNLRNLLAATGPIVAHSIDRDEFRTICTDKDPRARERTTFMSILLSILSELLSYLDKFVKSRRADASQKKTSGQLVKNIDEALSEFHGTQGRAFLEAVARRLDSRTGRDAIQRQCRDFAAGLIEYLPALKPASRKRKRHT